MTPDVSPAVLYACADGIGEIRFNRPERLNAVDIELAEGFAEAVGQALSDDGARVIVLSAEGRAFVAGGDLAYLRDASDRKTAALTLIDPMHAALKQLAASPKITIGSLKGPVAGAGMSIALNLDLVVAADTTSFNFAYARVAASPDCGGSWALPRLIGLRRALKIALLSETIDAAGAEQLGLVSRVVAEADLATETRVLAQRLASGPTYAHGRIKALMRAAGEQTFDEQLDAEAASFGACASTADFSEALDAFFSKRRPHFIGR